MLEDAVEALPYSFLEVTDEKINIGNKPGSHNKDNAARREKRRQYRKSLKARKKAEVKLSLKKPTETQNSDLDTLFDAAFSESWTELIMTTPPPVPQSFNLAGLVPKWVFAVTLPSLGVQLWLLWAGTFGATLVALVAILFAD